VTIALIRLLVSIYSIDWSHNHYCI